MKKHLKKRMLSLFLAFVMILGMVPANVYAEETSEVPFTVTVNNQEITEIVSGELTWTSLDGSTSQVPCYTVTVPQGATEATLTFDEKMQWCYYDSKGNYVGVGDTSWTSSATHTIAIQDSNNDSELDGVSVQIPDAYSTSYYILFVYAEESPEDSCLTVAEDAVAAAEVSSGGLYQLNLQPIFADSGSHDLTYSYKISPEVENEHTKIADGVFYFTATEMGSYVVTLTATCADGKSIDHTLNMSVKEASQGQDCQYNYDETDKSTVTVYVNISNDGMPILAADGSVLANLEVTVPYFDLGLYGLEDYYRYGTENGQGAYVNDTIVRRPTGLHLYIYLLERYYMGLPEEECCLGTSGVLSYAQDKEISYMTEELAYKSEGKYALRTSGGATSIYMTNFWGHDENLLYYRNHCYPYMSAGWGATSDYILLSDGDCWDVAMFTNWDFHQSGYFASFDQDEYTVEQGGTSLTVATRKWGTTAAATDFEAVNGSDGLVVKLYDCDWEEVKSLNYDSDDANKITFTAPEDDGTYYLLATDPNATTSDAKIAPAAARVVVGSASGGQENTEVYRILLDSYSKDMLVDGTAQMVATVLPAEATGWTISWSSDNGDVASVDQNGKVTALSEGTANITAAIGEIKASCTVTVTKYNSAPSVVDGAAERTKIKVNAQHTVDVAAMFTDAENDPLTYSVAVGKASGLGASWEYTYTADSGFDVKVVDGKCTLSFENTGIYALMITASDGKLTASHNYQFTVVDNDAGVFELNDGVTLDFYNVVVVDSSEEFVENYEIPYKGTYDTYIHNIVLSKDTLSGTPNRKMDITIQDGYGWSQYAGSAKQDTSWSTRADIGLFAYDNNGAESVQTAHYLKFYTECETHTDEDENEVCDVCTMKLGTPGQFALKAINADGFIIEPCYVTYAAGATLKEALKASGYTFEGIDSGFISAVNGVVDNFSLHYDGDGYSLDTAASEITAVWFTTNSSQSYSDDLRNLVSQMAAYNTSTDGVKDYTAAQEAYKAATTSFYQTSNAGTLYKNLKDAMDKYAAFLNGEKAGLTMNITLGGTAITTGKAVFTSEFGTTVEVTEFGQVSLIPGSYTFDVSDGNFRHVRGTIEVEEISGAVLTADLPSGKWMESVDLSMASGDNWAALQKSDATDGSATFYVPDYADYSLYPYVIRNTETTESTTSHKIYNGSSTTARSWNSKSTALVGVIEDADLDDVDLTIECRQTAKDVNGYELYQTFDLHVVRVPSLESLAISGDGTALKLGYVNTTTAYEVTTTSDTVDVTALALSEDAVITVNGATSSDGQVVNVTLTDCQKDASTGAYLVPVTVMAPNGQYTTYTISVTKADAVNVYVTLPSTEVSVQVFNAAGALISKTAKQGTTVEVYRLVPGETYTYISSAQDYYHATAEFTAAAELQVNAAAPKKENWATDIAARTASSAASELTPDSAFDAADHTYVYTVESNTSALRIKAASADTKTYAVTIYYTSHENSTYSSLGGTLGSKDYEKSVTSNTTYNSLSNALGTGGWGNSFRIEYMQKTVEDGVTYYQDYFVDVIRNMTLYAMSAADNNGVSMVLTQKDTDTTGFAKLVYDYTAVIGAGAEEMTLSLRPIGTVKWEHEVFMTVACGDWSQDIRYDNVDELNYAKVVTIPLSGTVDKETITVTVAHTDTSSIAGVYTIALTKLPPVTTTIVTTPEDSIVFLTEDSTGTRIYPEMDGTYELNTDASYTYVISRNGYVTQTASFVAGEANKIITVALEEAPESSLNDISVSGDWLQFRADDNNNGVVDVKTPIKAEDAVLEWANKIGEGFDSGATGCPIIVGDYLYTYAGKSIVKVNKDTGEVVDSGVMVASSSFAINSPTYAEGMIFVGLSSGRVQAFNAETLESLWVFQDSLGGQPNCPIVYCDGYVYTGFWNSETKQAHFVCLSVTDEDSESTTESKIPTWTYTHNGFYWAGAYACEDFVLIGTDDGESGYTTGYASILSLDPKTGVLLDEEKLTNVGDQRSSICYDEATDAYYFTTKGGDFYQIKVNEDGTFQENSLRRLHLDNGSDNVSNPPMSTSTPVVYNGRAYIGVSGTSQFGAYSGHNITVIDLESFSIAYSVPTMGYPQTSGLLTTAYEDVDGYVYVYFIDNYTPGMIRVIRDKKGMTEVDHTYTSEATVTKNGQSVTIETGYILFTPYGDEAQYAICSPITDSEGNLYFKNDTARLMRLSSRLTSLEITEQPKKLIYEKDMTFDGTGMKVVAHYANGTSKDITEYLSYTTEPLTMDDTEITVSFDPDKMFERGTTAAGGYWQWYRDVDGAAGQTYYLPTATVNIDLRADHTWDEGKVTTTPGCTEAGETTYTCEVCEAPKTEPITATGHSMNRVEANAPTCIGDGNVEYYTCMVCGKNYADEEGRTELISVADPATGHNMSKVEAKAPTCTEDGNVEYYTCAVCEKNYADEEGKTELSTIVDPATGHQMGEFVVTKEPTVTEKGEETSKCANCEYTEKREIPVKTQVETKLEITLGGITSVPESLKAIGLDTPEKVKETIVKAMITQNDKIAENNIAHYDVTLMYSEDGGMTWLVADETNFPENGKLNVVLPYPEGTDSTYNFTVVHMFTSTAFGKTPGDVEMPKVTNTENGIQFEITGLSPISVGWTAATGSESGDTTTTNPNETKPSETSKPVMGEVTIPESNVSETEETTPATPTSPATGDTAPLFAIAITMLLSAGMLVVLFISRRKHRG